MGREEGYNNKRIRYHSLIGYSMLKDIVKDKKVEVFRILGNCRKCLKVKILNTWVTIQSIDREVLMKFRGQNKYKEQVLKRMLFQIKLIKTNGEN